jgi:hypothetical protein
MSEIRESLLKTVQAMSVATNEMPMEVSLSLSLLFE